MIDNLAFTLIARNEEDNLQELLPQVLPHVDEVVIGVDASSTDNTLVVAHSLCKDKRGAVLLFDHEEFACRAHNRVQELVNSKWTVMLDADERFTPEVWDWLRANLPRMKADVGLVVRENLVDGVPYGDKGIERHSRLFKSDCRYISDKHQFIDLTGKTTRELPDECRILHHKTGAEQRRSDTRCASYTEAKWGGKRHLRLNIGSGNRRIAPDVINIDGVDYPNVDLVWDFTPRMAWDEHIHPSPGHIPFPDGCAKEVFCFHVLEHISYHHASDFMRELIRLLEPGGRLEIATPDFEAIVNGRIDGRLSYLQAVQKLYGGQDFEYNYHYNAVDWDWIRGQLTVHGCERIEKLPPQAGRDLPFTELHVEAYKKA